MHIPSIFKQDNPEYLHDIIINYPFASLITYSESGLDANHIPFVLQQSKEKNTLQGHIAKANPVWKNLSNQSEVLVIFNGPNCYISPNHYPTKKENGKAVPTWNYIAVHIKGTLSLIHDPNWNRDMLDKLTSQHESKNENPWSIADAPDNYIQKMLPAIVGLEIEIKSINGQWKLSQNQPEINIQGVIEGLAMEGDNNSTVISELVKNHSAL